MRNENSKTKNWMATGSLNVDKTLYLFYMAVKKDYQTKGYGAALWEETMRIAHKHNKEYILLDVNNKNVNAYNWYKRSDLTK